MSGFPRLLHTVIDAPDVRGLAEFYRLLLGLHYRPGDEPPGGDDAADWLVLVRDDGVRVLAFQHVEVLKPSTWPDPEVPMQLHLDFAVPSVDELWRQRRRAEELGASLRVDRSQDPQEPLFVFTDPAGHPFCFLVA